MNFKYNQYGLPLTNSSKSTIAQYYSNSGRRCHTIIIQSLYSCRDTNSRRLTTQRVSNQWGHLRKGSTLYSEQVTIRPFFRFNDLTGLLPVLRVRYNANYC